MSDENLFVREYDLAPARRRLSARIPEPHQRQALSTLRSWFDGDEPTKGGLLTLPTGGGKTFAAVRFLCTGPLSQGYKVLWLAHTHHLLDQAFDSFGSVQSGATQEVGHIAEPRSRLLVRVVSGAAKYAKVHQISAEDDVVIATLQSVTRAYQDSRMKGLHGFLESAQDRLIVVFDEAHHAPASSYRQFLNELRAKHPNLVLLGLTATPTYNDERRQGWLKRLFPQGILYQIGPKELMAQGVLARPRVEHFPTGVTPEFSEPDFQRWTSGPFQDLPEQVVEYLANNAERNEMIVNRYVQFKKKYGKTIIFADRWYQCEAIKELLELRGVRAGAVYSKVDASASSVEQRRQRPADENDRVLEAFRNGDLEVLINVRMLTEGTDVPKVQTVFLTRQVTSRILLTQMIGRALRGPKFGGTKEANIVTFADRWQQPIHFAEFDDLEEGLADDANPEYGKRPPLQLISIDLIAKLSRLMDSGAAGLNVPFLEWMPVGWYSVEFAAAGREDQTEDVRLLVMVYGDERPGYAALIERLLSDPGIFADLTIEFANVKGALKRLAQELFAGTQRLDLEELQRDLFQIARHVGQNEVAPKFFAFERRDDHDLDRLAREAIAADRGPRSQEAHLHTEYHNRDRFWQGLYWSFDQFSRQFQSCLARALQLERLGLGGADEPVFANPEIRAVREPDELRKDQVKSRDGKKCLCCGSSKRLQIDHIAPSYIGGSIEMENLQTLCAVCNNHKGTQEINYLIHASPLQVEPLGMVELPLKFDQHNLELWQQYLRRSLNFFYACAGVELVKIGQRGEGRRHWVVWLYPGNELKRLKPFLKAFVKRIQLEQAEAGVSIGLESLTVYDSKEKKISSSGR
jgi:superfamily II DNA or RNA helicase